MKKLLSCLALCALLLSLGTVFVSAELPAVAFTPGKYLGGDPEVYSPVGNITVAWRPNFADEVDLTDGDLSDWHATDLARTDVTPYNMVSWVREEAVADWKIATFCAADPDYLYLAFDIVDSDFAYASEDGCYDGDAIQLSLDFGHKLGDVIENNPDILMGPKNIFYSFSCTSDGAPIRIMRQESDHDDWLTEEGGDGVKGAAKKTASGWSAEIALSWQLMYDDYVWKAWEDDAKIYVSEGMEMPLRVGCALYYLNRAETSGEILWAAGTLRDYKTDDGIPVVSWTAYDNGITWTLPIQKGMFFKCTNIVIIEGFETTPPPETEPPYDPPVEHPETVTDAVDLPLWTETIPPEVEETLRDAAESLGQEDELNAVLEKYGCTSVIGAGSLAVLVTLAAAAFVIRKKK